MTICKKNTKNTVELENIWQGDLFNRKIVANDFSKIITSIDQPFVVSIDAQYGSGKTFFLERWHKELSKEEVTVFFNAWKCDFIEKPLLPFLYNFLEQLKEQKIVEYSLEKDISDSKSILADIGKKLINVASAGVVNIDELNEKSKKGVLEINGDAIREYKAIQQTIEAFKAELKKVIAEKLNGRNIYIFVDELERCRPTFAVELLESIKHLFDVDGLVFILAIDRSQLKTTISSIYGTEMNGEGYLKRFIDLELNLPEPNKNAFIKKLCNDFDIKNKNTNCCGRTTTGYDIFNEYFKLFADAFKLSLRDIEQCYTEFNIITKTIPEGDFNLMPLLAFLIVIKHKNKDLYNKIGAEYSDVEFLLEYLNKNVKPLLKVDPYSNTESDWSGFLSLIVMCFERNLVPRLKELEELSEQSSDIDPKNVELLHIYNRASGLLKELSFSYHLFGRDNIFELIKKKLLYTNLNN